MSAPDNQSSTLFGQTPWQTVGPFFHTALTWHGGADLVGDSRLGGRPDLIPPEHDRLATPRPRPPVAGPSIDLIGTVIDGHGAPVPDAMIETWQHGPEGFQGFARAATEADGSFRIRTLRPPPSSAGDAPHLAIGVFGRGLLKRLVTRAYFDDAPENATDSVLALVPAERRATLIARAENGCWRLDIVLQGAAETVFFDI